MRAVQGARHMLMTIAVLAVIAGDSRVRAAALAPVQLAVSEQAPIVEELNLTGTVASPRTARLAAEVSGRVAKLHVDAGDHVASGEVLVELDAELARLELEQARAEEREATVALADAERRLAEARKLAKTQSFAETEVRSRATEVERAQAVLERRRAALRYQAAVVVRHTLTAPFDGVVASRHADLGEWVTPDTPVLQLVAVDRLRLELRIPQRHFPRIERGTPVEVRVDLPGREPLAATVSDIVPVSDPGTRTFLVRVDVDNHDGLLTPGMSARAVLRMGTGRQGVVVPRDALIRYPDGRTVVWIARGEGEVRTVSASAVRTGSTFGPHVEVREGLDAGTPVVVRGNEALQENQEVRVSATR